MNPPETWSEWRLGVIGVGTIGSALAKVFSYVGYSVATYDVNPDVLERMRMQGFETSNTLEELLSSTNISFICVPTPTNNGRQYHNHLEEVLKNIVEYARLDLIPDYHVTVVKSTVLPTILEDILTSSNYKEASHRLGVAVSPEFVRGKLAFLDFFRLPFLIVSGYDERAVRTLKSFYLDFIRRSGSRAEIIETDPRTACLAKYASNCLLSCKISFFNEFSKLCRTLGVNEYDIVNLALSDRYPTSYWYLEDFLKEGFRDECLPKDLEALLTFSNDLGIDMTLLEKVKTVNDEKTNVQEEICRD